MIKSHNFPNKAMRRVDRRSQLQHWVETRLNASPLVLEPASADASFRRYFRVRAGRLSLIAMDAPPAQEDCRPFVRIAGLLAAAGVHVPRVIAEDLGQGFLLLSDLGTTSYLQALNDASADELFGDAIDALLRWQLASRPDVAALRRSPAARELNLFRTGSVVRSPRRSGPSLQVLLLQTSRPAKSFVTATTCRAT